MTITGTQARYELTGSATPASVHVSGGFTIGTSLSYSKYTTAPDIVYSLAMSIAAGQSLTLAMATGAVTGTIAGASQIETATVVAAGGCTSNGTCSVVVTGSNLTGSPITVPVALTTATHTTAALIATAIKAALIENSVIAAQYTPGSSSADVTLTDLTQRPNDATLNIEIPSGLGITAAPTSADTQAGAYPNIAYRITGSEWDAKDAEGIALPSATKLYSVLLRTATQAAVVETYDGTNNTTDTAPFVELKSSPDGNHKWNGLNVAIYSDIDALIYLDIHAGT